MSRKVKCLQCSEDIDTGLFCEKCTDDFLDKIEEDNKKKNASQDFVKYYKVGQYLLQIYEEKEWRQQGTSGNADLSCYIKTLAS